MNYGFPERHLCRLALKASQRLPLKIISGTYRALGLVDEYAVRASGLITVMLQNNWLTR